MDELKCCRVHLLCNVSLHNVTRTKLEKSTTQTISVSFFFWYLDSVFFFFSFCLAVSISIVWVFIHSKSTTKNRSRLNAKQTIKEFLYQFQKISGFLFSSLFEIASLSSYPLFNNDINGWMFGSNSNPLY